MRIVEIAPLKNGGHANGKRMFKKIPEGFAVIPDEMETPNFPFGEVEVEEIDGVMTVTKWIPGAIPKVEEPERTISEVEKLRADIDYIAVMTGVEL